MAVPEIFDRHARRLRRDRATGADSFLIAEMADTLFERLGTLTERPARALLIGAEPLLIAGLATRGIATDIVEAAPRRAALAGATLAEEDALPAAPGSYDLIISAGCLDSVADLPGALRLIRRALAPDGLLLAAFLGAPGLAALRDACRAADGDRAIARLHPQIDVRAAGDLLVRAGFTGPVADVEILSLAYASFTRLVADLRDAAATNVLAGPRRPVSRAWLARAAAAFAEHPLETISIIVLTGRAPGSGAAAG